MLLLGYSGCRHYDYCFCSAQYLHCGARKVHGEQPNTLSSVKSVKRLEGTNSAVSEGTIVYDPKTLAVLANVTSVSKELYKQHSYFGISVSHFN